MSQTVFSATLTGLFLVLFLMYLLDNLGLATVIICTLGALFYILGLKTPGSKTTSP